MNKEDIIDMAQKAGIGLNTVKAWSEELERFFLLAAAAGAAAEREACAKVCDQSDEDGEGPDCWGWHAKDYARVIRARGEK